MVSLPFFKKTKSKVFIVLYSQTRKRFHMREIERLTGEHINAVREALLSFVKAKLITSETVGKKRFFQANKDGVFYDELLRIVAKKVSLGHRIIEDRARLGKVKYAFLTDSYYRQNQGTTDEIDLFLVGTISLKEVSKITAEESDLLGREINFSVMDSDEFAFRKKNKDPFLASILQKDRVMLIGQNPTESVPPRTVQP
ncbi:hypothetical protein COU89_02775 [Candidatus Roizmanbacteria bacterium CG10_big_fil_rev_8_21_14_0_10_45_7]|uniref:Transcriptional regulator n=1 Tax=Candidatus Roizmanbacteria bacterium CG10_big_fil_rev_8_21_14_0_10_45_7 TaxID=1974854 RepID=A0A2M8KUE5_9BACT|nr:MAG: hypothetical protein COU89_02775 [Candidatus Roizmanbacteria bacterium CG10_big_fil_rev_8_21_14_0_10_45_7]